MQNEIKVFSTQVPKSSQASSILTLRSLGRTILCRLFSFTDTMVTVVILLQTSPNATNPQKH